MTKRRCELLIEEELYYKILEYQQEKGLGSFNQTLVSIIEPQVTNKKDEILQRLDELEIKINEGAKASYGCLNLLSFLYRDVCAIAVNKLNLIDKRFTYWKGKSPKDIFMFFRSAGNGCIALDRINFWKSYKFARTEMGVRDGDSEELVGLSEADFSKLVTGVNDATAMRTRDLDD